MLLEILILAAIGGIIGWITNVLAIKMLFRPVEPVAIPILNIKLQGLIPKRRSEISKSIGEVVEHELVSMSDIVDELVTEENKLEAIGIIKEKLLKIIDYKIPNIVPGTIKGKIIEYFEGQIDKEAGSILDNAIDDFVSKPIERIKIGKMVEQKIDDFELEKIEEIIFRISSKELKHIELLGGVLGFIIGLLQGIIVQFI